MWKRKRSRALPTGEGFLQQVVIACGRNIHQSDGVDFRLCLTATALNALGVVPVVMDPTDPDYQEWFVDASHRHSSDQSIVFTHDNPEDPRDGGQIKVNLELVPTEIVRILFSVTIWQAEARGQTFGSVTNPFVQIYDEANNREIDCNYLNTNFPDKTHFMFCQVYRDGDGWKFRPINHTIDVERYREEFDIRRAFSTDPPRYSN